MGSEWALVSIEDLGADTKGAIAIGPFGSRMKSDCYVEAGVPVIRGTNISDGPSFKSDFVFITEEMANTLGSCNVFEGDLVFPHRGSIGEVGIVPSGKRYVISSSLMKLTCNQDIADPAYLYYFFKSAKGRHELLKNASQVGTPGIGQPLTSLKSITLPLPPIAEQQSIAGFLKILDDKIELNRQMNTTLEAMAQAMFKSWFVDFDPVIDNALAAGNPIPDELAERAERRAKAAQQPSPEHPHTLPAAIRQQFPDRFVFTETMGWLPEGWCAGTLEDMLVLQRGFDLPKTNRTDGDYPLMAASGQDGTHSEFKVKGPGITTGRSGKLGDVNFVHDDFWPLNTTLWIKEYKSSSPYHALYLLRSLGLETYNSGSAVPTLNRNYVHNIPLGVPAKSVVDFYSRTVQTFYEKMSRLSEQQVQLAALRDALLPKLLSGQLRIPEAEQMLAEAL